MILSEVSMNNFSGFIESTFPSEYRRLEYFRENIWAPIVNKDVETEDTADRKNLNGRGKSFPRLLMGGMERDEESVKYSDCSSPLDVWIGIVA